MFVIFDLDGTLADHSHREYLLEQDPVPWEEFYQACDRDLPIEQMINTMRALQMGGARIEIWTGRSDLVREKTEAWLSLHRIPVYMLKRMRPNGDHGNDAEMKQAWLYDCDGIPDLVFEDRQRVVDMWRAEGIACCQVHKGTMV